MNKALKDKRETVRSGSEGMTIIELMVVLVIASIFAIAMFRVFETSSKMASKQNVDIDAQESIRAALNFMAKDLSMAGLATGPGTPGILIAEEARIQFQADRDLSGAIDPYTYGSGNAPELVEYRLEDPSVNTTPSTEDVTRLLLIPNNDPNQQLVLLENVTDLSISYIDPNGVRVGLPLADPADEAIIKRIRSVEITISARAMNTGTTTGRELTFLKWVRCRNLGIW